MKTIVVTNRKGGVGKTTVATHIAAGLAMLGKRVALVDTDPQGHVSSAFGMPKEDGLYNIMADEDAGFAEVVRQVPLERYGVPGWDGEPLYLLPGSKRSAHIPARVSSPFRFRRVLHDMSDLLTLDYVVVDTSPSNSMMDGSIMLAADYFLYVTEMAALSFDGLNEAFNELAQMNLDNQEFRTSPAEVLGIVPNKARFSTNNHRDNIRVLADQFGRETIYPPVTLRTVWESAFEYGQLVFSYAPYGQEFRDAWDIVGHVARKLQVIPVDMNLSDEAMKLKEGDYVTA